MNVSNEQELLAKWWQGTVDNADFFTQMSAMLRDKTNAVAARDALRVKFPALAAVAAECAPGNDTIHEYAFDITLTGAVRVKACDEETARRHLAERLDCADANLGCWMDGTPILAEVSLAPEDDGGAPRLYEIDGESVDPT